MFASGAKTGPAAATHSRSADFRPSPLSLCHNGRKKIMNLKSHFPKLGAIACVLALSLIPQASLAAPAAQEGPAEVETSLFFQDAHWKSPKGGPATPAAITVAWIPEPIQEHCLGKDLQECSTIDFCIRTTTKTVAMCKNLPANLRNLPRYPAGTTPPRVFSITFSNRAPNIPGFDNLRKYVDAAPSGSFDQLSMQARITARVRLTGTANNGNFALLEVVSVPAP